MFFFLTIYPFFRHHPVISEISFQKIKFVELKFSLKSSNQYCKRWHIFHCVRINILRTKKNFRKIFHHNLIYVLCCLPVSVRQASFLLTYFEMNFSFNAEVTSNRQWPKQNSSEPAHYFWITETFRHDLWLHVLFLHFVQENFKLTTSRNEYLASIRL